MIPPVGLSAETIAVIEEHTRHIAEALDVRGLINVQFAVTRGPGGSGQVFVIEADPRASRTVPFVAKATGVPLVKIAARVACGATLAELRDEGLLRPPVDSDHIAVKEAVLPFSRFPESDALLGPEMRSTGEVMGIDLTVGQAFAKSQLAAGDRMPDEGTVFMSLADRDKALGVRAGTVFSDLGFSIIATAGTAAALEEAGVPVEAVIAKLSDDDVGVVDLVAAGKVQLVVNSPRGRGSRADGAYIRAEAGRHGVPLLTTASAALAAANGIGETRRHELSVRTLQEYHQGVRSPEAR